MINNYKKTITIVFAFSVLFIFVDQIIKIWIKTNMIEHQMYEVTRWFKIYFIENEGMAYGITLGSKLFLTMFRIVAMSYIGYFIVKIIKSGEKWSKGFLASLALIFAGGWGNIIDCVFYGSIFSSSAGQVSQYVGFGNGYGKLFYGKVVDMLYFPIINTTLPKWLPFFGGEPYVFFSPIFNFADSCISVGVAVMILFYYKSMCRAFDFVGSNNKDK